MPDPAVAEAAGLVYVNDGVPGISSERRGGGWRYRQPDGTEIVDRDDRGWIDAIGIPLAWTDVWISPTQHDERERSRGCDLDRDCHALPPHRGQQRDVRDAASNEPGQRMEVQPDGEARVAEQRDAVRGCVTIGCAAASPMRMSRGSTQAIADASTDGVGPCHLRIVALRTLLPAY